MYKLTMPNCATEHAEAADFAKRWLEAKAADGYEVWDSRGMAVQSCLDDATLVRADILYLLDGEPVQQTIGWDDGEPVPVLMGSEPFKAPPQT